MKIPISEARRRLPELVRRVKADAELRIQITVHGEEVAELSASSPQPAPGMAAMRLQELMARLPIHRGPKRNISGEVKKHLTGKRR